MTTKYRLLTIAISLACANGAAAATPEEMAAQLDALQRQIETLQTQMQGLAKQAEERPVGGARVTGPDVTFGGQYRVNAYTSDNDVETADDQTAARVRIRQNIDFTFNEQFKSHLQLELGHTNDNLTTTVASSRGNTVAVRHAVMDYTFENGINTKVGIVPLSDKFGDTQFSGDWDYNPVAAEVTSSIGPGTLRVFAANLWEGVGTGGGSTETDNDDDIQHYQGDYTFPIGGAEVTLSGTYMDMPEAAATAKNTSTGDHFNYGIAAHVPMGDWAVDGFVMGSDTEQGILGTTDDGDGYAAKLALSGKVGKASVGIMGTYAEGESDGSGFIAPMALAATQGYWGYTGILTVQGPTDTGIDGDSVNISNNGYGLATVQAKVSYPFTSKFTGYLAAGWFGDTDAAGRDSDVGIDFLAMGTYRFNKTLALDFGFAAAELEDSVSGYWRGAAGRAPSPDGSGDFNQAVGDDRDKYAAFARFQAEF